MVKKGSVVRVLAKRSGVGEKPVAYPLRHAEDFFDGSNEVAAKPSECRIYESVLGRCTITGHSSILLRQRPGEPLLESRWRDLYDVEAPLYVSRRINDDRSSNSLILGKLCKRLAKTHLVSGSTSHGVHNESANVKALRGEEIRCRLVPRLIGFRELPHDRTQALREEWGHKDSALEDRLRIGYLYRIIP